MRSWPAGQESTVNGMHAALDLLPAGGSVHVNFDTVSHFLVDQLPQVSPPQVVGVFPSIEPKIQQLAVLASK